MMSVLNAVPAGLLLPESFLLSDWFSTLATFVAINTVIYVILGIIKIVPLPQRPGHTGRSRRSETRSIYPDGSL